MAMSAIAIGGLIAVAVPLVLRLLVRSGLDDSVGQLRYSRAARFFAAFMLVVPPIVIATAVAFQARPLGPVERFALVPMLLFFPLLCTPMLVEFNRVAHTYDERGWHFRSPWSPSRKLEWLDVVQIRWRPLLKWLDFHPAGGGRPFHLSLMLSGLEGMGQTALAHIAPHVLEGAPDARAVLRIIAGGLGETLMTSSTPPVDLAIQLLDGDPPEG